MSSLPSTNQNEPRAENDGSRRDKTQRVPSKLRGLDNIDVRLHNTFPTRKRGKPRNKNRTGSQPSAARRDIVALLDLRPGPTIRSHSFSELETPHPGPSFAGEREGTSDNRDDLNESAISNSPIHTPSPSPSPERMESSPLHPTNVEHSVIPGTDMAPALPYSVSDVSTNDPRSLSSYGSRGIRYYVPPSFDQSAAGMHYPNYPGFDYDGSNLMNYTNDPLSRLPPHPLHSQNPRAPSASTMIPAQSNFPNQETFVQATSSVFVQPGLETSYFGQSYGLLPQASGHEENPVMTVQQGSDMEPFLNDEIASSMLTFPSRSSFDNIHSHDLYSPYRSEEFQSQYTRNGGQDSFPN